jgi:hypothetical protein
VLLCCCFVVLWSCPCFWVTWSLPDQVGPFITGQWIDQIHWFGAPPCTVRLDLGSGFGVLVNVVSVAVIEVYEVEVEAGVDVQAHGPVLRLGVAAHPGLLLHVQHV